MGGAGADGRRQAAAQAHLLPLLPLPRRPVGGGAGEAGENPSKR